MASSSAVGQVSINCQLCEADNKIKWKCMDCNLLLCEKCKDNVHPKFKNATHHNVINIKEVGLEFDDSKFKCKKHQGQDYCLFCNTCKTSVCTVCVTSAHNGHQFIELTKSNVGVNIELNIVQEFVTTLFAVEYLSVCGDGSIWISRGANSDLQKVKPHENTLQVKLAPNLMVASMAITESDDLLFVTRLSTKLKCITCINNTETKQTDSIFDVAPLQPTCVHVTKDDKVIIGARGGAQPFPVTGRRVIFIMSRSGNIQSTIEYDKRSKPYFSYVRSLCTTKSGRICSIDRLSSDYRRGRLLFFEPNGQFVAEYNGHSDINSDEHPFGPRDVATTPLDNIITADKDHCIIHILDNCGNLVTIYNTREIGIIQPLSFGYNDKGQLYIGCGSEGKARLYLVNISGC